MFEMSGADSSAPLLACSDVRVPSADAERRHEPRRHNLLRNAFNERVRLSPYSPMTFTSTRFLRRPSNSP